MYWTLDKKFCYVAGVTALILGKLQLHNLLKINTGISDALH